MISDYKLTDGGYALIEGNVVSAGTADNYNAYYSDGTLTLKDAQLTCAGMPVQSSGALELELIGSNALTSTGRFGVYCKSDLEVSGTGSLSVSVQNAGSENSVAFKVDGDMTVLSGSIDLQVPCESTKASYGLYVSDGDLTVSGGSLSAASGTSVNSSMAVYLTAGDVTVTGGSLKASGGDSTTKQSYGIYAAGLSLQGGQVVASSGTSDAVHSRALHLTDSLDVTGGSLTANGGAAKSNSYGAFVNGKVTVTGGSVKLAASTDALYGSGLRTYADVTITGGTVDLAGHSHAVSTVASGSSSGGLITIAPELVCLGSETVSGELTDAVVRSDGMTLLVNNVTAQRALIAAPVPTGDASQPILWAMMLLLAAFVLMKSCAHRQSLQR